MALDWLATAGAAKATLKVNISVEQSSGREEHNPAQQLEKRRLVKKRTHGVEPSPAQRDSDAVVG
jgi:hypothetical protein